MVVDSFQPLLIILVSSRTPIQTYIIAPMLEALINVSTDLNRNSSDLISKSPKPDSNNKSAIQDNYTPPGEKQENNCLHIHSPTHASARCIPVLHDILPVVDANNFPSGLLMRHMPEHIIEKVVSFATSLGSCLIDILQAAFSDSLFFQACL